MVGRWGTHGLQRPGDCQGSQYHCVDSQEAQEALSCSWQLKLRTRPCSRSFRSLGSAWIGLNWMMGYSACTRELAVLQGKIHTFLVRKKKCSKFRDMSFSPGRCLSVPCHLEQAPLSTVHKTRVMIAYCWEPNLRASHDILGHAWQAT